MFMLLVLSVVSNVAHPDGVCTLYPFVSEVFHASYSVHKLTTHFTAVAYLQVSCHVLNDTV